VAFASSQSSRVIVDAHVHLYDSRVVRYGVFEREDPTFEARVGDYAALPRAYILDDYLQATRSRTVEGIVWHEFIAENPLAELQWAQRLAMRSDIPTAFVGLVNFAELGLAQRLDLYGSVRNLTAVRQHLGWDSRDPLRRMAARPDFMSDAAWLGGLDQSKGRDLRCGLEVFSPQLEQLLGVVRTHPDILFTVAVMGWPTGLGPDAFARWRLDIDALAECENTCASISAIECIFGLGWTEE
jgi:predicted TIM-barrel fold metal-dependent hydrolase